LPKVAFDDLENYTSNPSNTIPQRTYYFEYNPRIVVLPKDQQQNITHPLTGKIAETIYLAIYRVCQFFVCRESLRINKIRTYPTISYMGVALLDHKLDIIVDGAFDNHAERWEDFCVFVLHNAMGQPQMYVGSFQYILPMWIQEPSSDVVGPYQTYSPFHTMWPQTSTLHTIYLGIGPTCRSVNGGTNSNGKKFQLFSG
jgi:hypothetical protein